MYTAEELLRRKDKEAIEKALPAHMMVLMLEQCAKEGIEARPDLRHHLNVASIAPLSQLDTLSIARIAKSIDDTARTLLHDISPDDGREGLYVAAAFVTVLIDEGRMADKTNQAVLASALLWEEAKLDEDENDAPFRVSLQKWETQARQCLFRANMIGLYLTVGV